MAKKPGHMVIKLIRITNLYDITVKQVYAYVRNLHRHIRHQNVKIRKLRRKLLDLKKLQRFKLKPGAEVLAEEAEKSDVDEDDVLKALEKAEKQQQQQEAEQTIEPLDVKAFVDDIKKTAQDFDYQNRYIYEPTSGMYYDPDTGYYYNAIYGLHYDGQRGCYLKYNEQTLEYEFYSQVIPQETLEEQKPKTREKKRKHAIERRRRSDSAAEEEDQEQKDIKDRRRVRHRRSRSRSRSRKRDPKSRRRSRSRSYYSVSSRSSSSSDKERRKRRKKEQHSSSKKGRDQPVKERVDSEENKEEGELDSSSGSGNESDKKSVILLVSTSSEKEDSEGIDLDKYADIAKKYPPSLRLVVQETNVAAVKKGSLFIVTCKGGSLGREGDHDVIIPDINVSKYHIKFIYNKIRATYQLMDLGSRNGTLLNGTRMAPTMQESDTFDIVHGDVIELNHTKLLCHIHDGNLTCGNCEPGLLMKGAACGDLEDERITKPVSHKEGLKLLQKRYGLEDEKYVEPSGSGPPDYNDRAAHRRKVKGSTNEHAKTQAASVDQHIGSENKGFKMLSKLGWSEGKTLGKNDDGLKEPIPITSNVGTSGLGSQTLSLPTGAIDDVKKMIWMKTQKRYEACANVVEKDAKDGSNQSASLNEQIGSENKGFQMLAKLGWNEGQTLGKNEDGLKEPIGLLSNVGTSGLGSKPLKKPGTSASSSKKKTMWKKKQDKKPVAKTSQLFEGSDSE